MEPATARKDTDRLPLPRDAFPRLAQDRPDYLALQMRYMSPGDKAHAALALGAHGDGGVVVRTLLQVLDDHHTIVREAAVRGLAGHLAGPEVLARLRALARNEQSPAVQEALSDVLEGT